MKRLLLIATVFLPAAVLYLVGGLEFLERRWIDARFELSQRPATSDIVLVDIDPRSLRQLDRWPWPRGYHATVLEQLLEAGASRVGFDVDFSSRSIREEDRQLQLAIESSGGRVVLPVFHQWQRIGERSYLSAVQPIPEFRDSVTLGSINVVPDSDGLVRRYASSREVGTRLYPSFASALRGVRNPVPGEFHIDFGTDPQTVPRLSYVDVLTGQFDPDRVRDKTVIVGPTAIELGDQMAVPISASLPGPLLQALAFESLANDRALGRTGRLSVLIGLLLLALLLAPAYGSATWRRGLLLTLACAGLSVIASIVAQRQFALIVDTAPTWMLLIGMYSQSLVRLIDRQNLRLMVQRVTLRRTEDLMRHVVANSFDAIVGVDSNGVIDAFNPTAQRMFGYAKHEVVGAEVTRLFPVAVPGEPDDPLAGATESPMECRARRGDGSTFPVELVVTRLENGESQRRVAFLRDITDRKLQQRNLEHQATHDALTDLPNRGLLSERALKALLSHAREGKGLAMLLLDLDRFKDVNDALGHDVGDRLLQKVARRLGCPLDASAVLARLGGDEFAILLPDCDAAKARETAHRLVESLKSPFDVDDLSLHVDTSIGIALYPDHADDEQTLLRQADVAMYVAKQRRTSVSFYDPDDDLNSLRHLLLRGDLRRAIENDGLSLAYQPRVDSRTAAIVGVEALLRWNHPEHGPIAPDEFIPLAEHAGLIRPLTRWVCRTALRQCADWNSQGLSLNVSVNLSAHNLVEEDLPETIQGILAVYRVPARQLTLEITESVIMEDPELALRVVTRLRELGIGISIDDFGTGYSSLGYLVKLPAQELKIDKSFVMQMDQDPGNGIIVHSTIELAHNLGLKVVAEGVETAGVWNVLKHLGCDYGQGYLFSRPVGADELLELPEMRVPGLPHAVLPDQADAGTALPAVPLS
jgi:diguanylate cyclase (GGDEF)-like protein/PAS domain S-box-containing protein